MGIRKGQTDGSLPWQTRVIPAAPQKKRGRQPIVIGALLLALCGAGGFAAVYLGFTPAAILAGKHGKTDPVSAGTQFVTIDPMVVSLAQTNPPRHLRFQAVVEVDKDMEASFRDQMPRILDVLNGYLRALRAEDLQRPSALFRLRIQLLHRFRTVIGAEGVRDVLVTEFVLN